MSDRVTYFSVISNHTKQNHSGWIFDALKEADSSVELKPIEVSRALPSVDTKIDEFVFFAALRGHLTPAQKTFLQASAHVYPDSQSYEAAKKACYQLHYTFTPEND